MDEKLKNEIINLIKEYQFQDSIEIGNSKTGVVKVYVDFNNLVKAEEKIINAIVLLRQHRKDVLDLE